VHGGAEVTMLVVIVTVIIVMAAKLVVVVIHGNRDNCVRSGCLGQMESTFFTCPKPDDKRLETRHPLYPP
jgi:hypothetical protein